MEVLPRDVKGEPQIPAAEGFSPSTVLPAFEASLPQAALLGELWVLWTKVRLKWNLQFHLLCLPPPQVSHPSCNQCPRSTHP